MLILFGEKSLLILGIFANRLNTIHTDNAQFLNVTVNGKILQSLDVKWLTRRHEKETLKPKVLLNIIYKFTKHALELQYKDQIFNVMRWICSFRDSLTKRPLLKHRILQVLYITIHFLSELKKQQPSAEKTNHKHKGRRKFF